MMTDEAGLAVGEGRAVRLPDIYGRGLATAEWFEVNGARNVAAYMASAWADSLNEVEEEGLAAAKAALRRVLARRAPAGDPHDDPACWDLLYGTPPTFTGAPALRTGPGPEPCEGRSGGAGYDDNPPRESV